MTETCEGTTYPHAEGAEVYRFQRDPACEPFGCADDIGNHVHVYCFFCGQAMLTKTIVGGA
jgi:hypothetical protein